MKEVEPTGANAILALKKPKSSNSYFWYLGLAPPPQFTGKKCSHLIYTDLIGDKIWIRIG